MSDESNKDIHINSSMGIWLTIGGLIISIAMYEAEQDREISLVKQQVQSNTLFNKMSTDGVARRLGRIEGQLDQLLKVKL